MLETDLSTPTDAAPVRKRGRPRKGDSADNGRRMAVILAAARQFRDKGFDAATTRDIATQAGMQSGSPFYHFKSKHELLFAIMEEGMLAANRSQAAVLAALPDDLPPQDMLQALVLNHLYVLWLPGNDFVPVMIYEWRSLLAEHRQQVQGLKNSYEAPWREVLQRLADAQRLGTDASVTRSMLFGILHGSMRWFQPKGRLSLEALALQCVNALVFPEPNGQDLARTGSSAAKSAATPFDVVAAVRRANGLSATGRRARAQTTESPLAQHVGRQTPSAASQAAPHAGASSPAQTAPADAPAAVPVADRKSARIARLNPPQGTTD